MPPGNVSSNSEFIEEGDDSVGSGANSTKAACFVDFGRCDLFFFSFRLHVASELREIFSSLQNSTVDRFVELKRSMIFIHSLRVRRRRPSVSTSNWIPSWAENEES